MTSIIARVRSTLGMGPEITAASQILANRLHHHVPYGPGFPEGRVDAGLDQLRWHDGPIYAVANGTITKITPTGPGQSWSGMGAIYYKIDQPVTVHGKRGSRTYANVYAAEMGWIDPKLKVGARVKVGQKIAETKSGWSECGFYDGQPLSGSAKSQEGYDWCAFYHWTLAHPYLPPKPPAKKPKPPRKPPARKPAPTVPPGGLPHE